jgi:FtsP/CotA-like multicopper oxidase with cupredoxin domain
MIEMKELIKKSGRLTSVLVLLLALPFSQAMAQHEIRGITGPTFDLYAFPFNMSLPDGSSMYMWGFGDMDAGSGASPAGSPAYELPQYPGPTLIVTEGEMVTINLTNSGVPDPVSIVVTGHDVTASGGVAGLVTQASRDPEDPALGGTPETVAYSFTASEPGTYAYHSLGGANPGLHAEMGLQGVLIVRPNGLDDGGTAYGADTETDYDQEFLYLLTEIDPDVHLQMERGHIGHFTQSDRAAKIWFVNGRVFPDLFQGDYNSLFPHQPYQSLSMAHPGDRVLVRAVNAGHDSHPFHFHGENLQFVARDGRVLSSGAKNSDGRLIADLGRSDNTLNSAPKQSVDMIWTWTGQDLGWDIYGHQPGDPLELGEDADDHGNEIPVKFPGAQYLTLGGWWSGSPFLGDTGDLPPGEGGLNPHGGYFFVWHSHAEKELTTFDIFPGGSLSAVVILPHDVTIDP